tara:strand:- start:3967 stop:4710 length:744 start_codon:yes stop_codon:yes gene_type:complete
LNISDKELKFFSRQLILNDFSEENLNFIRKQEIILIGIGGIGCPIAQYLISSGVKNLTLIDKDIIEINNLNRQILYNEKDIGKNKAQVAKEKLDSINNKNNILSISEYISEKNISKYLSKASLVIDTTDNWNSMVLINEYCVKKYIPLLSCSAINYDGQIILFENSQKKHLCLRCIYTNKKNPELPRCDTVGIMPTTAGLTGLIATQLIINYFTNNHQNIEKIIMINAKLMKIDYIKTKNNPNCKYM